MDSRFGREVVVGSIVLAAALVFGAGVLWLNGKSINPRDDKFIVQLSNYDNTTWMTSVQQLWLVDAQRAYPLPLPTARYDAACQAIIESQNGEDDLPTL